MVPQAPEGPGFARVNVEGCRDRGRKVSLRQSLFLDASTTVLGWRSFGKWENQIGESQAKTSGFMAELWVHFFSLNIQVPV